MNELLGLPAHPRNVHFPEVEAQLVEYSVEYKTGYEEGKQLTYILHSFNTDYVNGWVSGLLDAKWDLERKRGEG